MAASRKPTPYVRLNAVWQLQCLARDIGLGFALASVAAPAVALFCGESEEIFLFDIHEADRARRTEDGED
jgi:hypothetical protein